jgi:TonB family protein
MRPLQFAPISGRRRKASDLSQWIAPSLVVHAALIAASGVSLVPHAKGDDRPAHEVIFLAPLLPRNDPAPPAEADDGPGRSSIGWNAAATAAQNAGEAVAAAIGRTHGSGHALAQATRDLASAPAPDSTALGDDHIFQAVDVDREVTREADAVAPVYPEELRLQNVQGAVTVEFVVDTTGRIEAGSLHVIGTTHPLFATAVREAAPSMHFRPAVRSGHLVRQQVIQSFQFVLQQPAAPPDSTLPKRPPSDSTGHA